MGLSMFLLLMVALQAYAGSVQAEAAVDEQNVQSDEKTITGHIQDAYGESLVGVSVVVKGTTIGTITDINGNFNLKVPVDASTLLFSFIGMETQEVALKDKSIINIVMKDELEGIDEVVVVGFGVQKSSAVVSSVAQITTEELNVSQRPVTSGAAALVGAVPGLVVTTSSGAPGSTPSLSIRGTSTTNDDDADMLVIIDNFEGSLSDIDPQTIESVSVLKDASAVSIYGARGANGVLLVTTKNTGKDRKTIVTYNFNASVQSQPRVGGLVNSLEYMNYQNEIQEFWGNDEAWDATAVGYAEDGWYPDTDWADELYESGVVQQSHNLTVTGGSKNTGYLISAGYFSQDGLAVGDDYFERYNLRLKIDSDITDWLTIGANALISNTIDNDIVTNSGNNLRGLPMYPVKSDDGYWVSNGTSDATYNVVADASSGSFEKTDQDRYNVQMYVQLKPLKGLTFEQRASVIKTNYNNRDWNNVYDIVSLDATDIDSYTNADSENRTYYYGDSDARSLYMSTFQGKDIKTLSSVTYDFRKSKHTAKVFAAMQTESGEDDEWGTGVEGFEFDNVISLDQGDEATDDYTNGVYETRGGNATTLSFFGRLNYNYADKYLLEGTFRADASSYFTDSNKWGYFPSAAVGWVASREDFMSDVNWIQLLKVRASYGSTGDDGSLGSQTQQLVSFSAAGYPIGGVESSQIYISSYVNEDLKWETATIFNVGIDASLFDGKFQFEYDYFINNRSDIIAANTSTATEYGFGDGYGNYYSVKSWGWEANATYKNKIGNFGYKVSGNISWYDNEITELTDDAISDNFQVGQSVNDRYGYETDGFFDDQDEIDNNFASDGVTQIDQSIDDARIGGFKYVDQNDDGIINSDDKVILEANSDRNWNMGLNLSVNYKNLSLSSRIYGALYRKQWLNSNFSAMPFLGDGAPFKYMLDAWSVDNPDAMFPFPESTDPVLDYNTSVDRFLIDSEYIKCQNITLNYNFGQGLLTRLGGVIKTMNVYVSAENVGVIWTNNPLYDDGWDPELGMGSIKYPMPFTLAAGLSVKF
jgi:TonB-linked SusC/RagA family outer membrane protein